jgi:hypothetical protein
MNWQVPRMSQGENYADNGWLENKTECLVIINPGVLSESAKNPMDFVSVKGAISMKFVTKNRLPSDNIGLVRTLNQIPGVIARRVAHSSSMALHQLGSARASRQERGIGESTLVWRAARGWWYPALPRVAVPWALITNGMGTTLVGSGGPCLT